jgi:hypothetical protein
MSESNPEDAALLLDFAVFASMVLSALLACDFFEAAPLGFSKRVPV